MEDDSVVVAVLSVRREVLHCPGAFLGIQAAVYVTHGGANDAPFDNLRCGSVSIHDHSPADRKIQSDKHMLTRAKPAAISQIVLCWTLIEHVTALLSWVAVREIKKPGLLVRSAKYSRVVLCGCEHSRLAHRGLRFPLI
jgi:hypothetical protein